MDEYISREDVLDIASQYCPDDDGSCSKAGVDLREMLDEIEALPSTDVQSVKQGRWMCEFYNDVFDVYQADCSVCKRESTNKYDKVSESYEYCPHCGARMDGDTNE